MRMPDPRPLGLTRGLAMERAIAAGVVLNRPGGGWGGSVLTRTERRGGEGVPAAILHLLFLVRSGARRRSRGRVWIPGNAGPSSMARGDLRLVSGILAARTTRRRHEEHRRSDPGHERRGARVMPTTAQG